MKTKIWFKGKNGTYMPQDGAHPNPSPSLIQLGMLLSRETMPRINLDWIMDPNIYDRSGNESYSYKEGDKMVISMYFFDDEPPFIININTFYKLAKIWQKIYDLYPDRVDLTEEDGKFTFEYDTDEGHQIIVIE